ncbi:uncharacterized protein B0H18DRAFT_44302 [Fomitopsis serialis]|uniref:uncharacterized protein n=1 Tax=Fomitopsis serialis TaxID=139415 RepID=UPI0020074E7F|nr:uncharacterized protein B0H18DRAFT_44302 [Neoantrodia serialis]KAH9917061.1 hypothetical protein B0H18DRAFT_44302 [Neoantrodia serialis]
MPHTASCQSTSCAPSRRVDRRPRVESGRRYLGTHRAGVSTRVHREGFRGRSAPNAAHGGARSRAVRRTLCVSRHGAVHCSARRRRFLVRLRQTRRRDSLRGWRRTAWPGDSDGDVPIRSTDDGIRLGVARWQWPRWIPPRLVRGRRTRAGRIRPRVCSGGSACQCVAARHPRQACHRTELSRPRIRKTRPTRRSRRWQALSVRLWASADLRRPRWRSESVRGEGV